MTYMRYKVLHIAYNEELEEPFLEHLDAFIEAFGEGATDYGTYDVRPKQSEVDTGTYVFLRNDAKITP